MPTLCSCGCGGTFGKHIVRPDSEQPGPEVTESADTDQAGKAPASPATPLSEAD